MKKIKVLLILFSIIIFIVFSVGLEMEFLEDLDIPAGAGIDIEKKASGEIIYSVPVSLYIFGGENTVTSKVIYGISNTLGETRQDRQRREDKKFIAGLQRTYVLGEEYARYGIKEFIDILFVSPVVNDMAKVVVCKGKSAPILEYKIEGYPSSSDFIEGLIKNAIYYNFFSDNYKVIDMSIEAMSEGRLLSMPYIELGKKGIEITGMAIFKDNKMVTKLDMQDTKIMNILREDDVRGNLTLQNDSQKYIDFYGKSKRKVKCSKEGNRYKFSIDLSLTGELIANEMYDKISSKKDIKDKFEKDMAEEIEKESYKFIEKMKNQYKLDILELGRCASAKYGRQTGVNWDEIASNSDIVVNAKVKLVKFGRGDY